MAEPSAAPEEYGTKCTSCGCNRRKPAPRLCMSPNEHVEFIPAKLPEAAVDPEIKLFGPSGDGCHIEVDGKHYAYGNTEANAWKAALRRALAAAQPDGPWDVERAAKLLDANGYRGDGLSTRITVAQPDGWIAVSERLPEPGVNVLIISMNFQTHSQHYTAYRSEPMTDDSPTFWRDSHTGAQTIFATHWCPLPTPPVQEKV